MQRLGWAVFAATVAAVLGYATYLRVEDPMPRASSARQADGSRFGLSEARRRAIFQAAVHDEPQDRAAVVKHDEYPNFNKDSAFHQREWGRLVWTSRQQRVPLWQVLYILDEGIHEHWPPPPGVELRADDGPMAHPTTPLAARALISRAP